MEEIYWLTRLDGVIALWIVVLIFGFIYLIVFSIKFYENEEYYSNCHNDMSEKDYKRSKKYLKTTLLIVITDFILLILTPTTKEALIMYGIGNTIDYLQSNETAKQLPDKFIKALDVFATEYLKDRKDEKTSN